MRKWKQRIITAAIALVTAIPIGILMQHPLQAEAAPAVYDSVPANYEYVGDWSGWQEFSSSQNPSGMQDGHSYVVQKSSRSEGPRLWSAGHSSWERYSGTCPVCGATCTFKNQYGDFVVYTHESYRGGSCDVYMYEAVRDNQWANTWSQKQRCEYSHWGEQFITVYSARYREVRPKEYYINYNANGGSGTMSRSTARPSTDFTLPNVGFSRTGYSFAGWATSSTGGVAYSNGQTVRDIASAGSTITLYAKWTPNDIKYKVEHYKENMSGGYDLAETENLVAKADQSVTPARKSYTGFDSPAAQTQSVGVIDNTLTIKYYYPRHIYNHKVYVRYQKVDGSWGPYALENSTNLKYEYAFNWSKAECQEYKGASISHATPAYDDTHYVDIERQKYDAKLIVYYQNVDGLGDADATFTPVVEVDMPQTFYGTTINWVWNPKTGFLTPVNAKRRDATPVPRYSFVLTGDTTIELWCFRELVTFDVNGAKLNQTSLNDPGTLTKFGTTDGMGVWNLYINSKLANTGKITDFYSTQMLWGSTWEIKNIDEAAGNHYYGADVN